MAEFLYTIKTIKNNPTLSDIAEQLNINESLISKDFGVLPLEDGEGSYCILLDEKALPSLKENTAGTVFSNPTIEPFGLEEE